MKFSALVDRIAGEAADAWATHYEAARAHERGEDVIVLSIGDPDIDTPRLVVDRAIEKLRAGDTHYTPAAGRVALRAAIAAEHARRYGQTVTAGNVIVLAGAQNALFVASLCVAGAGDEVIALEPLYPTYPASIEITGAQLIRAPSPAQRGFRPDVDAIAARITPRTRAIFFATPNNPSGVIANDQELAGIAALARQHSLWIVADQVYAGLAPEHRVPSLATVIPDRLVTIGSLSKSHAMPGWRMGWMVAPAALIEHAERVAMCMLFGLPGFIQEAALAALGIAEEAETRVRAYCAERCRIILECLRGIAQLECLAPQAGMFLLVDVARTGLSGREFMRKLYEAEKVSVLDGGAFGIGTAHVVRICFAAEPSIIEEGCRRIRRFCERLGGV